MVAHQVPAPRLLAELDELLRTLPAEDSYQTTETGAWVGRAQAVVSSWDRVRAVSFEASAMRFVTGYAVGESFRELTTFLHKVRFDLVLKTTDTATTVVSSGQPFGYFDEVRKVIERARSELFFVDPYLTDDFVTRYMPYVAAGTKVRLMGRENNRKLIPSVDMFKAQSGLTIEVRSGSGFHDRFVFVDGSECLQSSASFHQGGKTTPAVLTPMHDAAKALLGVYNGIWAAGT